MNNRLMDLAVWYATEGQGWRERAEGASSEYDAAQYRIIAAQYYRAARTFLTWARRHD